MTNTSNTTLASNIPLSESTHPNSRSCSLGEKNSENAPCSAAPCPADQCSDAPCHDTPCSDAQYPAASHDAIWAPWRLAFILDDSAKKRNQPSPVRIEMGPNADPNCFLCQAVFDEEHDRQRYVARRTDLTISVLNKFPYNNGHLLVAPRCHVGRLDQLTDAEKVELLQEIDRWVRILEEEMNPEGFNIGLNLGHVAGAGLPGHLHWHIVPRWSGDTNFMPVLAAVKVIPQSLEALWEILCAV
ncbi:MAG: HIT family protein [Thermoguttaceae bacterium]